MRKLATIQKILKIEPIEGADKIVLATVLGWHVIVLKKEYKVGDLVVFFEVDSLLPVLPAFDFLAKDGTKTILGEDQKEHTGYRLKTIRLRGQISQGLCIPIGSFPDKLKIQDIWKEGKDITDKLGVIKYEKFIEQNNTPSSRIPVVFPDWIPRRIGMFIKKTFPKLAIKLWGKYLKPFPEFIPKTDEIRLQNFPKVLIRHQKKTFYITEKVDGSSLTFFHNNGDIGVCSRNIWYPKDYDNKFWKPIISLNIEEKLKKLGNYAMQGELMGEGIQGNKLMLKGTQIYFFNVLNISTGKYLSYKEFIEFCKNIGVQTVPILNDKFKLYKKVDKMVEFATIKSTINPNVLAEGMVFRPLIEAHDQDLGRLSFKVVNPEFLIKYAE